MLSFVRLIEADISELMLFFSALFIVAPLFGWKMAKLYQDNGEGPAFVVRTESILFRVLRIDHRREMAVGEYLQGLIWIHLIGFLILASALVGQGLLDPAHRLSWDLILNIAVSFVTNTNWQSYAGETSLNSWTQSLGLTVQNFMSAAVGLCLMAVLGRALRRKLSPTVGNLWKDLWRSLLFVLLPLSLALSVVLMMEGVPQTWPGQASYQTLEGKKESIQVGAVASQVAIKQLGSNGGGFYSSNSAHPLENPSPLTNLLESLAILFLPVSCLFAFGAMIRNRRHSWALFAACATLFAISLAITLASQLNLNASLGSFAFLEGIDTRIGPTNASLWTVATTATSNGSVNSALTSLAPLGVLVALFNILMGEVVFGGVGVGIAALVLFSILTVFLAGLMVGRTPEYLGKKVESEEVVWSSIGVLLPSIAILIFTAIAVSIPAGLAGRGHEGPHGFTEILYGFASAGNNNGSALGSLSANSIFYNLMTAVAMILGRFGVIVPVLVLSGLFAGKKITPASASTFPTHGALFSILLIGVILIVGALTFFPALGLGPIVEYLLMLEGRRI